MDLRQLLSPEQFEAATHTAGPVCILAGAGSGKTRVITHRIAFLIQEKKARPWSILAVTFTNKAAGEMKRRVEELVPGEGRSVKVGTFHGMAARFLRQYGDAVSVPRSFVIYDQDDSLRLMKRVVIDECNWSKDLVRPFLHRIGGWQCDGLTPADIPDTEWDERFEQVREAYILYWERLAGMGAVDFGGLLLKFRELLLCPAGREITDRIQHVLVDEYQDVNRVQTEIIHAFAENARTLAVVGDDDQAIYGWRGADADNLKHFVDRVEHAHLVRLEDNYRSTANILECANGIIGHNHERLGKVLRARAGEGRRIRILRARDDIDEARRVVALVQEHLRHGDSPEEIAILYRANATSRMFEDELRRASIGYRLVGGVRFYDRKEVKDVLALLRCALNSKSDVDTVRMIGAVPRGIGAKSLSKIQHCAIAHDISLLACLGQDALLADAGVTKRAIKAAAELSARVVEFGEQIRGRRGVDDTLLPAEVNARDAVALATEISGVSDRLEAEGTLESEGRQENLAALLNAAAQFVDDGEAHQSPTDIIGFLEDASLLGGDDVDPSKDDQGLRVTLMTLHSAKGLEYKVVFLVGLEEDGFPHAMATKDGGDASKIEEERRLAYVGITRAKERLVISWAKRRMVQGTPKYRSISRFLTELPRDVLEGDIPPLARPARGRFPAELFADPYCQLEPVAQRQLEPVAQRQREPMAQRQLEPVADGLSHAPADSEDEHVEYDPEFAPVQIHEAPPKPSRTTLSGSDISPRSLPTSLLRENAGLLGKNAGDDVSALERSFRAVKERLRGGQKSNSSSADPENQPLPTSQESDSGQTERTAAKRTSTEARKKTNEPRIELETPPSPAGLRDGGRVEHNVFGLGTIVGFRGQGRLRAALVHFEENKKPRVIICRHLSPVGDVDEVRVVPCESGLE